MEAQMFTVVKITQKSLVRSKLYKFSNDENIVDSLYKIVLKADSSGRSKLTYFFPIPNVDTLSLIEELLSFEGDKRICSLPIQNYDPLLSQIYMGKLKRYSIQLEALYIINHLYFDVPYKYSPYPILIDNGGRQESVEGRLVEKAYISYKDWLKKLKKIGLREAKHKEISPLDEYSSVKWYH